jgi:hypothetical protein
MNLDFSGVTLVSLRIIIKTENILIAPSMEVYRAKDTVL